MIELTREIFEQQRRPRFGNANPERMHFAFWEWMIRGDAPTPADREGPLADESLVMRDGKLKSSYGPYRARDLFKLAPNREDGPIWTFDRMGATRNRLPSGKLICIGGEHEDFYDPDFCIYNDVIVFDQEDIRIYGYPKEVFPPTDFHSASLLGNQLIVIGGLGYKNERIFGSTPVYALDLSDFHIEKIENSGDMPGWIHGHEAQFSNPSTITIRGGQIVREYQGKQQFVRNLEEYVLDLDSKVWRRITERKWYQAKIRREDNLALPLQPRLLAEALLPRTIPHTIVTCERRKAEILIENIEVCINVGTFDIEIVVQGILPRDLLTQLSEEILMNAQVFLKCKCNLQAF